jgi:3-mercaptopyruvate sulfurtransferase SseA
VAQELLDAGWTDVRPLLGGLDAWVKAGYPLEPKGGAPARPNDSELSTKEMQENLQKSEGDQDQYEA